MTKEKVQTYEDACNVEGVDPIKSLPYPDPQTSDEKAINAFAKIIRLARVLNEGWHPNWDNNNEYKYYPWFDFETYPHQVGSGVGFSYGGFVYAISASGVGSRLCFKTSELAEYAGKQFLSIYREFMIIEK